MKKRILATVLCVAMVFGLVACGGKETTDTGTETTETESEPYVEIAISNENIDVAKYRGLIADAFDETVTDADVDSYIEYVMNYMYTPQENEVEPIEVQSAVERTVDGNDTEAVTEETTEETVAEVTSLDTEAVVVVEEDETADQVELISEENEVTEESHDHSAEIGAVDEVKTYTIADLTDTMVSEITMGEYTTIPEYREYIKGVILEENRNYYNENLKSSLFQQVVNNSTLKKYDEAELEEYIKYANDYYVEYAEYLGVEFDAFCKDTMGFADEAAYNDYVREESLNNLKTEYIINAIAEEEKIVVTEEDVEAEINNYITNGYFESEEAVLEYISREEIETNLKYYQILEIIVQSANYPEKAETVETPTEEVVVEEAVEGEETVVGDVIEEVTDETTDVETTETTETAEVPAEEVDTTVEEEVEADTETDEVTVEDAE